MVLTTSCRTITALPIISGRKPRDCLVLSKTYLSKKLICTTSLSLRYCGHRKVHFNSSAVSTAPRNKGPGFDMEFPFQHLYSFSHCCEAEDPFRQCAGDVKADPIVFNCHGKMRFFDACQRDLNMFGLRMLDDIRKGALQDSI